MNIIDMLEDPVSKIIIIDLSYQRHYKLYNLFHSINVHIANI